jgi:hypothetical protein
MFYRRHRYGLMHHLLLALIAAAVMELLVTTCTGPANLQVDFHLGAGGEHARR